MLSAFGLITEGIGAIGKVVDDLFTSDEERLEAKTKLKKISHEYALKALEFDSELVKARSSIIVAEAKGESWLQRNWRPLAMITFLGLAVFDQLGIIQIYMTALGHTYSPLPPQYWTLLTVGLGGYVAGRSGEKIMKSYGTYSHKAIHRKE